MTPAVGRTPPQPFPTATIIEPGDASGKPSRRDSQRRTSLGREARPGVRFAYGAAGGGPIRRLMKPAAAWKPSNFVFCSGVSTARSLVFEFSRAVRI